MPELNGIELVRKLQERNPQLEYVYMSGYSHEILKKYNESYEPTRYLQKPFDRADLIAKLENLL